MALVKLFVEQTLDAVSVSWHRIGSDAVANVTLALDEGPQEAAAEDEVKSWADIPPGIHYVIARVNGTEEARETFSVQE